MHRQLRNIAVKSIGSICETHRSFINETKTTQPISRKCAKQNAIDTQKGWTKTPIHNTHTHTQTRTYRQTHNMRINKTKNSNNIYYTSGFYFHLASIHESGSHSGNKYIYISLYWCNHQHIPLDTFGCAAVFAVIQGDHTKSLEFRFNPFQMPSTSWRIATEPTLYWLVLESVSYGLKQAERSDWDVSGKAAERTSAINRSKIMAGDNWIRGTQFRWTYHEFSAFQNISVSMSACGVSVCMCFQCDFKITSAKTRLHILMRRKVISVPNVSDSENVSSCQLPYGRLFNVCWSVFTFLYFSSAFHSSPASFYPHSVFVFHSWYGYGFTSRDDVRMTRVETRICGWISDLLAF